MSSFWRNRLVRAAEWSCYAAGLVCSGFFLSQLAVGEVERQADIASFEQLQLAAGGTAAGGAAAAPGQPRDAAWAMPSLPVDALPAPDTRLWSPGRIADYQASLQRDLPPVLGILNVPSLGLELPVYSTDSELTMDRGAGVIDGMAYPHEGGNIGIAGHRDGYFRALKDISLGDKVVLETLEGPKYFTVDATRIVEIEDTHVLADTDEQRLTLVTCYPFYFVGHAPQRFVVSASLDKNYVNLN